MQEINTQLTTFRKKTEDKDEKIETLEKNIEIMNEDLLQKNERIIQLSKKIKELEEKGENNLTEAEIKAAIVSSTEKDRKELKTSNV